MEIGRFTIAEESLRAAVRDPNSRAGPARHGLSLLLVQEGRVDEAREWIETVWQEPNLDEADRIRLLHDHIALEFDVVPIEWNLTVIEHLAAAKEDDRTWLTRANMALLASKFDEAETWLDACRKRRPDDPVVWRVRLRWAMAADRTGQVGEALAHLPVAMFTAPEVARLRAWLVARERSTCRYGRPGAPGRC